MGAALLPLVPSRPYTARWIVRHSRYPVRERPHIMKTVPTASDVPRPALFAGLLAVLLLILLAAAPLRAQTEPVSLYNPNAVVNVSSLNLRSGPHVSYTAVAYLVEDQRVLMVGRNRGATWAQIELPNGYRGWVNARYLNVSFPVSFLPVVDVGVSDAFGLVTGELLYVLRGPAFVYRPLFLAQPGDQFPLLGRDVSASWYYVALGNGLTGWIPVTSPLLPSVPIRDLPIAAPFVNSDVFGLRDHYQLYIGPDYAFQSQSELIAGQQLMVVGRSEDGLWLRVRLPDGTEGWVDAAVVSMPLPISTLPAVNETPQPVTITPAPTATNEPTATVEPTATTVLTATSEPTATLPATATPAATATLLPTATATTLPPTATLVATSTPAATVEGGITLPPTGNGPSVVPYYYVYASPLSTGDPLTAVDPGQVIVLLGRTADSQWVQIALPGGTTGWLQAQLIQASIPVEMLPVVEP